MCMLLKKKIGRRLEKAKKSKVAADAWVEFRFSLCRDFGNTNKKSECLRTLGR